jgi:hypothetical protein
LVWVQSTVDFAQRETKVLSFLLEAAMSVVACDFLREVKSCQDVLTNGGAKFKKAIDKCNGTWTDFNSGLSSVLTILHDHAETFQKQKQKMPESLKCLQGTVSSLKLFNWIQMGFLAEAMFLASSVETVMRHKLFASTPSRRWNEDKSGVTELAASQKTVNWFLGYVSKLSDTSLRKDFNNVTIPDALERQFGCGVLVVDLGPKNNVSRAHTLRNLVFPLLTMGWAAILEVDATTGKP